VTLTQQLADWASPLEIGAVPENVRALAQSLVLSQLAAARATRSHELGEKIARAFGPPLQNDPKQAAYTLAALTIALDYDDTVYAGHVTHAAVNVPLVYSRTLERDGASTLVAIVAAIECAARVTAAATLGAFRGQTAGHSHLVGAVTGRLHIERKPVRDWVNALGIALAAPPWPLMRAFLGSEAKVLTAATPVRVGLDACDAVAGGLNGAADILEHPDGFLATYASVPLPEAVVRGLGTRWHTETASLKVHPGSAYLDGCIDCAIALHRELGELDPDEVFEVRVETSIFTAEMERRSASYLDAQHSSPIALGFSVGYSVATALLTGALTPRDLSAERVADLRRWRLAEKVHVEQRSELTLRAVGATAPVGEALRQAGERAVPWLESSAGTAAGRLAGALGPPVESFELAEKAMCAHVTVRFIDGRQAQASRDIAVGAAGPDLRRRHSELMRDKFLATGGSIEVVDGIGRLEQLNAGELAKLLSAAFRD
jgi:2-methylcitrate dehydratase PrpD